MSAAVNSAPGYAGIPAGTRYNPVKFSTEVIERLNPTSLAMRISTPTMDVGKCGTTAKYRQAMQGEITELQNNGTIKHNDSVPLPSEQTLVIDQEWAFSDKYSEADFELLECNDRDIIEDRVVANMDAGSQELDKRLFNHLITSSHRRNKGIQAGRLGNINLGAATVSGVLELSSDNIEGEVLKYRNIFSEWNINMNTQRNRGDVPFIIAPVGYDSLILASERLNSYIQNGPCVGCPTTSGVMDRLVHGFEVATSSCLPAYKVGNDIIQPVIFGFASATKLSVHFQRRDMRDYDPTDRSVIIQGWWSIGNKTIDPRKVGVAFYKIKQPNNA